MLPVISGSIDYSQKSNEEDFSDIMDKMKIYTLEVEHKKSQYKTKLNSTTDPKLK